MLTKISDNLSIDVNEIIMLQLDREIVYEDCYKMAPVGIINTRQGTTVRVSEDEYKLLQDLLMKQGLINDYRNFVSKVGE